MTQERVGIMGAHEIREQLGLLSRQRVYQITARPDFPAPVATLMQGKIWLASDVDRWIRENRSAPPGGRRPDALRRHRVRPARRGPRTPGQNTEEAQD